MYTIKIHPQMTRAMDSRVGPLLTHITAQKLRYEEKVVIMHPNKITWLEYGRNTLGKHLICLCTEMNTQVSEVTIEIGVRVRNVPSAHLPMHTL